MRTLQDPQNEAHGVALGGFLMLFLDATVTNQAMHVSGLSIAHSARSYLIWCGGGFTAMECCGETDPDLSGLRPLTPF